VLRVLPSDVVRAINEQFPWTTDWTRQLELQEQYRFKAPDLLPGVLQLVRRVPEDLLVLNATQGARLILATEGLQAALDRARGDVVGFHWPRLSDNVDCLVIVRQALEQCPDEAPSQSIKEMTFISDERFRRTLCVDLGSAERALNVGEWKAATVLAGSVLEALLLWALQRHSASEISDAVAKAGDAGKVSRSLPADDLLSRDWALHQYIEVAHALGEIKEHTANPCREAKYYRNLIHPAAAERDKERCTRGKAHGALGAVYSTIDDLEEKYLAKSRA